MSNINEEISFEKAISELEEISSKLQNGNVSLDESIKLFERGVKLSKICSDTLSDAKQKIISLYDAESEEEKNEQ